ncbi:putative methyltransferase C9orf114 [Lineus longissimus]|uniref:putative methyltransferase C9orf114 n=1 Tax=Lineus longissimus TaxID=88925 RepID=UPI002B4EA1DF
MKRKADSQEKEEVSGQDWKKWKSEKKADYQKWKEQKLIKKIEKEREKHAKIAADKVADEKSKHKGRSYTVSIALPGSILDNAQSPELRTYLAGQIARAAVVFNVDEIVVFDESGTLAKGTDGNIEVTDRRGQCNIQLARILQYLECPQYLRKSFFPQHTDLKYAGILNPLDSPHHMRADMASPYREGVVLNKPVKEGKGSFVNVGLLKEIRIDKHLQHGLRVTVKLDYPEKLEGAKLKGKVVAPSVPRTDGGLYWGYTVRIANTLGAVFAESPHKQGYDMVIGTSDKGESIDSFKLPKFSHLLIVFGGLKGLEASLEADQTLQVDDPGLLFQHYLNTCPSQGSRTIRTEEAILITMATLRPQIHNAHQLSKKS